MSDETKDKIIKAAFKLIAQKGYSSMTTKEIANLANVNEVTLFRKFESKKGIIITALKEINLFPELNEDIFSKCLWSLEDDLSMFSKIFFSHVNKEYAKIIIGLQDPQIFPDIKDFALRLPNSYKKIMTIYFTKMFEKKAISINKPEALAGMFLALNFGFIFSKTSYGEDLTNIGTEEFTKISISVFSKGIKV
jgi:hypothetical protein